MRNLRRKGAVGKRVGTRSFSSLQKFPIGLTQLSDPNKGFKPLVQARNTFQVRNSYPIDLEMLLSTFHRRANPFQRLG